MQFNKQNCEISGRVYEIKIHVLKNDYLYVEQSVCTYDKFTCSDAGSACKTKCNTTSK